MSRQAHGIDKGKENSKLLLHHDNKETPSEDSQVETPQVQERRACCWGLGDKEVLKRLLGSKQQLAIAFAVGYAGVT